MNIYGPFWNVRLGGWVLTSIILCMPTAVPEGTCHLAYISQGKQVDAPTAPIERVSGSPLESENGERISNCRSGPRQLVVGLYFFFASINNSVPRSAVIIDALGSLRLCGLGGDPCLTPCTPEEFPGITGHVLSLRPH